MTKLTLEQVAELAGVSRSTASRVLRNQGSVSQRARDKVLQIVAETGFQPNAAARSLAGHHTNIIGFFITEISRHVFSDPYFGRLVEGVTQAANENDQTLALFLLHSEEDTERMTARILQNPLVDGLVISSTLINNPIIPKLLERDLPFVVVGRHDDARVNYVDTDNLGAAFTATSHLLRLGYQRIGTITGTMSNFSAIDRLQGFKDAHREWGRELNPNLIYEGNFIEISGYDGMKQLLTHQVDAVFAASDAIAVGALQAIREAGLTVPEDIALVGFDDLPFAATVTPPLTTMRQTIRRSGKTAVNTLLQLIGNKNAPPRRISLPTELVIRTSCGALQNDVTI